MTETMIFLEREYMFKTLIIRAKEKTTAEALMQQLAESGIESTVSKTTSNGPLRPSFKGQIEVGSVAIESTPAEVFEFVIGIGPTIVDALFNILERFADRIELLVDGKRTTIAEQKLPSPFAAFEAFLTRSRKAR